MSVHRPAQSSTPTDTPCSLLQAWTALEALSPQTFKDAADLADGDWGRIALFEKVGLPWWRGEKPPPTKTLYYQLVLGAIRMADAAQALDDVFGVDEEASRRQMDLAAIAAVMVDDTGRVLTDNGVAVSSFAWALPKALTGDLAGLGAWTQVERDILDDLMEQLRWRCTDEQGQLWPLEEDAIEDTFNWLVSVLRLDPQMCLRPGFAVRVFHPHKARKPPEAGLLNSFYLADLARATELLQRRSAGEALARYLGLVRVEHGANLLADHALLEDLVAPLRTPAARWPSRGGHPLVTLQQAAVNAARAELAGAQGVVAVNGPPGTGKTTLLRDIVAANVLDRAIAMVAFDDPESAFRNSGQKAGQFDLYRLDASLRGHEMVVASSNNKAVENVSRELPARGAVGRDIHYFQTIAQRLMQAGDADEQPQQGPACWGLIAAVLGNGANRSAFQRALWWDEHYSLRQYLKAARGDNVRVEWRPPDGGQVEVMPPAVVIKEDPPTPQEARVRWREVCEALNALHAEVQGELVQLEAVRRASRQQDARRHALHALQAEVEDARLALEDAQDRRATAERQYATQQQWYDAAATRAQQGQACQPGLSARLVRSEQYRKWQAVQAQLDGEKNEAARWLQQALAVLAQARQQEQQALAALQDAQARFANDAQAVSQQEDAVDSWRAFLQDRFVDNGFFEDHERWNLAAPWIPKQLHQRREDLFEAALEVHKAFIDAAASKVLHNLGALMDAMTAGALPEADKRALLGDLWSTLFLVVPVVSTTFASMDRMLGDLPSASLGWLLIDEAGQATPQSAVGALMRAQRAIVVGDPMQVPPVVSLPQGLVAEICRHFNVSADQWAAPAASVQTLADSASRLQAEFRSDGRPRRVGLPLLVHRRCQEPMFGISNKIAYDRQMVHGVEKEKAGRIEQVLGPSAWLNVDGRAQSKWSEDEGDAVVWLLEQLAMAGVHQPDIYVITPFRAVASGLRQRLRNQAPLLRELGVMAIGEWLRDRVGTVHTFQGKEAEAVVCVLGAPMPQHLGARQWATKEPNILNVMVSRAKRSLYVVGSRHAWGQLGHCRAVADALPPHRP